MVGKIRSSPNPAGRSRTIGQRAGITTLFLVALLIVAPGGNGWADRIPIPSGSIMSVSIPGPSGAATVFIWDHFDRADAPIGTAVLGGPWSVNTGSWTVQSNVAGSSSVPNANASITVPGVLNGRVDVDLTFALLTASAGVELLDDGTNGLVVEYKKGLLLSEVRLYSRSGGTLTQLASAAVISSLSAALTVIVNANSVQVLWNSVSSFTYNLTPGLVALVKDAGSNRFGMWANSDAQARFNNFRFQSA